MRKVFDSSLYVFLAGASFLFVAQHIFSSSNHKIGTAAVGVALLLLGALGCAISAVCSHRAYRAAAANREQAFLASLVERASLE